MEWKLPNSLNKNAKLLNIILVCEIQQCVNKKHIMTRLGLFQDCKGGLILENSLMQTITLKG